jgi:hypothetical protein
MQGKNTEKLFVYAALFLAIALIFQNIRLVLPLPGPITMFLIGSLLNMTLILAVCYTGVMPTSVIGILLPIVAFMQGQLAIPFMIPIVAVGNIIYVLLCRRFWRKKFVWLAPFIKTAVLYVGCLWVIHMLQLPEKTAAILSFMMSWPQIITGLLGIILARIMLKKLPKKI